MRKLVILCSLAISLAWGTSFATPSATFESISGHYEAVRQALLYDNVEGVAGHAGKIEKLAAVAIDAESGDAAVCSDPAGTCDEFMPEIQQAASRLQSAESLEDSREAFGELSRALVKYRQEIDGPKPVVAYCSMAQKVWLQPKGEIGNPYYGQSMATCGEIVSE